METTQTTTLLRSVITLRDLLDQEQEPAEEIDVVLLTLLDTFVRDGEYELGTLPDPYGDDLTRRIFLKQILHAADRVLDAMNEQSDSDLSPAAVGLCRILFEVTFASFLTIRGIEAAHPEHSESFAAERAVYNATRES